MEPAQNLVGPEVRAGLWLLGRPVQPRAAQRRRFTIAAHSSTVAGAAYGPRRARLAAGFPQPAPHGLGYPHAPAGIGSGRHDPSRRRAVTLIWFVVWLVANLV